MLYFDGFWTTRLVAVQDSSLVNVPLSIRRIVARWLRWRPLLWSLRTAVKIFAPKHRVGVIVIVLDEQGRILLLRHVFHPTSPWGPPGGWLGRGEAPDIGAARELREETGITAEIGPLIALRREKLPDHLALGYIAHVSATAINQLTLSNEILEAAWFEAEALPPRLTSFTRLTIQAALNCNNTAATDAATIAV